MSGEIKTHHPGYLRSQNTFYSGKLKGGGRIYQKTFVDTYCKLVFAKLYDSKTPITSAVLINHRVLLYFEQHDLPMLRRLTHLVREYCGRMDQQDYSLYLAINGIAHTKIKAHSQQTSIIFKLFYRTIPQDFYQVVFHRNSMAN